MNQNHQQSYPALNPRSYSNDKSTKICPLVRHHMSHLNVTEITNLFRVRFSIHYTGWNSFLAVQTWPTSHTGDVIDTKGESTATILLKGHNIKLPSNWPSLLRQREKFLCTVDDGYSD